MTGLSESCQHPTMGHDSQQERHYPRGTTVIIFKSWVNRASLEKPPCPFSFSKPSSPHHATSIPLYFPDVKHSLQWEKVEPWSKHTPEEPAQDFPGERKTNSMWWNQVPLHPDRLGMSTGCGKERGSTDTVISKACLSYQTVGSEIKSHVSLVNDISKPSRGPGCQLPSVRSSWVMSGCRQASGQGHDQWALILCISTQWWQVHWSKTQNYWFYK